MLKKAEIDELEHQAIVAALFRICDPRGMENLKCGDTVQLKSGGPIMTLGAEMDVGGWQCKWFDGNELKTGLFRIEQLKKAEPEKEWDGSGV